MLNAMRVSWLSPVMLLANKNVKSMCFYSSFEAQIVRNLQSFLLFVVALFLVGCAGPETRLNSLAKDYGFVREVAQSDRFSHVVYRNFDTLKGRSLSVYLEGDGSPWLLRYIRMPDPTPRSPMMLKMMALDHHPALYLGRPCYNGFAHASGCDSTLWTSGRYSSVVVNSMLTVLTAYIQRHAIEEVNLYGHSGGGTLAMLLAEQLPVVQRVVTLAANMDIDAWTDLHGYSPLLTSLNPARRPPLAAVVQQFHFMGADDTNIPPALATTTLTRQQNTFGIVLDAYDHGCCWQRFWPQVLDNLQTGPPYRWTGSVVKAP